MAAVSTKVTPADLEALATLLRDAGNGLKKPRDEIVPNVDTGCFGPRKDVAAAYVQLANELRDVVAAAAGRLKHGAEVFHVASAGFTDSDQTHGKRIKNAGPR